MTAGQTEHTRVHTILYMHIHAHVQHVFIRSEVCTVTGPQPVLHRL